MPATEEDLELFNSLRGRRCPDGYFIGDGEKAVRGMLARVPIEKILCSAEWVDRLPIPQGVDVRVAPREEIDRIAGLKMHQRVMALARIPNAGPLRGSFLVALDGISNAENVGAILRSCAAFGADGLIVGPETTSPWLRRAVRVSTAAGLQVPVHFSADLAETLRPLNAWAAHLYGDRRNYTEVDLRQDCCLVLGSEADGPSPRTLGACRGAIYIPMAAGWDCLNVAASAAVLLAEVRRQRSTRP